MKFLLMLMVFLMPAILTNAGQTGCPSQIEVKQIPKEIDGWTTFDQAENGIHRFINVGFSDGPPQNKQLLAPDASIKRNKNTVLRYVFPANEKMNVWLNCSYAGTSVVVAKPLPPTVLKCEVELDRNFGDSLATRVECVEKK